MSNCPKCNQPQKMLFTSEYCDCGDNRSSIYKRIEGDLDVDFQLEDGVVSLTSSSNGLSEKKVYCVRGRQSHVCFLQHLNYRTTIISPSRKTAVGVYQETLKNQYKLAGILQFISLYNRWYPMNPLCFTKENLKMEFNL